MIFKILTSREKTTHVTTNNDGFHSLVLMCVIGNEMTNAAHHTLADSVHQQPDSALWILEISCEVNHNFRVNKHASWLYISQFLVTIHKVYVWLSLVWPPPHTTGFLIVNLTMFNISDFKEDCSKLSFELIGRRKITVKIPHAHSQRNLAR